MIGNHRLMKTQETIQQYNAVDNRYNKQYARLTYIFIHGRHFLIYFDKQSDLSHDGQPTANAVVNDSAIILLTLLTIHFSDAVIDFRYIYTKKPSGRFFNFIILL